MSAPLELFASCAPGLEPLLLAEVRAIGALDPEALPGGVRFHGHRRILYRANLELGLAQRILLRLARFRASRFDRLQRELRRLPWERWLPAGATLEARVTAHRSRLHHSGALAERLLAAAARALGPPAEGSPTLRLYLRLERDLAQLSLDTSGEALSRRGYRLEVAKAPLREDLARALILASGWDRQSPLLDPLCGSGTIPIEAAILASRRAPGALRAFAFERTPLLHRETWEALREEAEARIRPLPFPLCGRDRDPGAIEAARANGERAGLGSALLFQRASLREPIAESFPELEGRPLGAVVSNPPYGRRIGDRDRLGALYQSLGGLIRSLSPPPRVALLGTDRRLLGRTGLPLRSAFLTDHGGLKVRALIRREGPDQGASDEASDGVGDSVSDSGSARSGSGQTVGG